MGFKDKLSKTTELLQRRNEEIINNTEAKNTQFNVVSEAGDLTQVDYYIDGESVTESLEAKRKYLDGASANARKKREKEVADAQERGRPLNEEEVLGLRKDEEDARSTAAQEIANMKRINRGRYGR